MKVKVLYLHAHVSTHMHKTLSLSFSGDSVSNYAGFNSKYFNYSIGCHVPQKVYFFKKLSLQFFNTTLGANF